MEHQHSLTGASEPTWALEFPGGIDESKAGVDEFCEGPGPVRISGVRVTGSKIAGLQS
jgi:hypothetical protein